MFLLAFFQFLPFHSIAYLPEYNSLCYEVIGVSDGRFEIKWPANLNFAPEYVTLKIYREDIDSTGQPIATEEKMYQLERRQGTCPHPMEVSRINLDAKYSHKHIAELIFGEQKEVLERFEIFLEPDYELGVFQIYGMKHLSSMQVRATRGALYLEHPGSAEHLSDETLGYLGANQYYCFKLLNHGIDNFGAIRPKGTNILKLVKQAVIKFSIITAAGAQISYIPSVTDVASLQICQGSEWESKKSVIFFHKSILARYLKIEIFDLKEQLLAKSIYSIRADSFDEKSQVSSDFNMFGVRPAVIDDTSPITPTLELGMWFAPTKKQETRCKISGQPARITEHSAFGRVVFTETLCQRETAMGSKIRYTLPIPPDFMQGCKNGYQHFFCYGL